MLSGCSQLIWGSFSINPVLSGPIFSPNLGQKRPMLSGPAIYVCGPLQLLLREEFMRRLYQKPWLLFLQKVSGVDRDH